MPDDLDITTLSDTDSIHHVIGEVHYQTLAAERAYRLYDSTCARLVDSAAPLSTSDRLTAHADILFAVDAFVAPLGRLSSLLFPYPLDRRAKERANARGGRLRRLLRIPENHFLGTREARSLRNALIHLDERIDEAIENEAISKGWSPRSWLPIHHDERASSKVDTNHLLSCFFLQSRSVSIFGTLHELQPLGVAVDDIRAHLDAFKKTWDAEVHRRYAHA